MQRVEAGRGVPRGTPRPAFVSGRGGPTGRFRRAGHPAVRTWGLSVRGVPSVSVCDVRIPPVRRGRGPQTRRYEGAYRENGSCLPDAFREHGPCVPDAAGGVERVTDDDHAVREGRQSAGRAAARR